MKTVLDDFELSFPKNILDRIIYEDISEFLLDVYYNETGYPASIHDLGGERLLMNIDLP